MNASKGSKRRKRMPLMLSEDTHSKVVQIKGYMEQTNGKIKALDEVVDRLADAFWKGKQEGDMQYLPINPVDLNLKNSPFVENNMFQVAPFGMEMINLECGHRISANFTAKPEEAYYCSRCAEKVKVKIKEEQ